MESTNQKLVLVNLRNMLNLCSDLNANGGQNGKNNYLVDPFLINMQVYRKKCFFY